MPQRCVRASSRPAWSRQSAYHILHANHLLAQRPGDSAPGSQNSLPATYTGPLAEFTGAVPAVLRRGTLSKAFSRVVCCLRSARKLPRVNPLIYAELALSQSLVRETRFPKPCLQRGKPPPSLRIMAPLLPSFALALCHFTHRRSHGSHQLLSTDATHRIPRKRTLCSDALVADWVQEEARSSVRLSPAPLPLA